MISRPRVLGVDPGLSSTGYALVRLSSSGADLLAEGTLRTSKDPDVGKNEDTRRRVSKLSTLFHDLLDETHPDVVCIEEFSYYAGQSVPMAYLSQFGRILGMMNEVLRSSGIDAIELPTRTIKKMIVGRGGGKRSKVTKDDVKRAVQRHTGFTPKNEHTADAAATAIAGGAIFALRRKEQTSGEENSKEEENEA